MARRILALAGCAVIAPLLAIAAFAVHLHFEGRPAQGRPQYVAMGSPFAAGPAITTAAQDSPWFCARSRDNYAHQLARLRGLSRVDVSCGGATTHHILDGGQLMQPAQIDAVTHQTELVTITITIGGNDIACLGNMMALACNDDAPWTIRAIGGCHVRRPEETQQKLQPLFERLVAIIGEVRRRALGQRPASAQGSAGCAAASHAGRHGGDRKRSRRVAGRRGSLDEVTRRRHDPLLAGRVGGRGVQLSPGNRLGLAGG